MLFALIFAYALIFTLVCVQVGMGGRLKRLAARAEYQEGGKWGFACRINRADEKLRKFSEATTVELARLDALRNKAEAQELRLTYLAGDVDRLDGLAALLETRRREGHAELAEGIEAEAVRRNREDRALASRLDAHRDSSDVLRGRLDAQAAALQAQGAALRASVKAVHAHLNERSIATSRARTELEAQLRALDGGDPRSRREDPEANPSLNLWKPKAFGFTYNGTLAPVAPELPACEGPVS